MTTIKIGSITELENGVRVNLIRSDSVPAAETFLSEAELAKLAGLKIEKRRRDWLGGRYAAKTLIQATIAPEKQLSEIEISYDPSGRPVWNTRLISITHSGLFCAAAASTKEIDFLGIDLEIAEPRAAAWYKDYFHESELEPAQPHASPAVMHLATTLWTRKEALLKALGLGLKADPLDIELVPGLEPGSSQPAIKFSRKALERYEEMGKPSFALSTLSPEPAYYLSIAFQTC